MSTVVSIVPASMRNIGLGARPRRSTLVVPPELQRFTIGLHMRIIPEEGTSQDEERGEVGAIRRIARTFRVSTSFVVRLLQRRRDAGTLAPEPHRGGPPPAMGRADQERLGDLIREPPDAALEQLRQRGGFTCRLNTLWLALRRRRLTRKKKCLHARQRDRPEVRKERRSFRNKVRRIEPKHLVFVDETGVTTAMTPAYARAPRGQRAIGSAPASWETVTVIAALGRDGVHAPLAFPGSTDTAVFPSSSIRRWCRLCTRGMWWCWTTSSPT